jgi:enoyl-[acyl-carrier protein] reductase II
MKLKNSLVSRLFNIEYPIIQGGMIWCSGWRLAAAVSNAGGLGLIGAGSMYPDVLREHIAKCRAATLKPFGVNVPLLYAHSEEHLKILVEEKVPIVFTSAGNPAKYTALLKENDCKVAHVVPNVKSAVKCQQSGVDAVVAEGFEAGGHNGREETTTMVLIPLVRRNIDIPLIAAGGIASGAQILAAMALGADGVQIGSLFASAQESSAHELFKQKIVEAKEGDTSISLKKLIPVRLLRNAFMEAVQQAEARGASADELQEMLGKGRARLGMHLGDMHEGELEIGQVSAMIDEVETTGEIMRKLMEEFSRLIGQLDDHS